VQGTFRKTHIPIDRGRRPANDDRSAGRTTQASSAGVMRPTHPRPLGFLIGSCAAILCAGCAAQHELIVLSDPPGAIVRLDETIVGTTPHRQNFEDYGSRRITLYRNGYRTTSEIVKISPPWYAYFPLDFISEVLIPVGWKDSHEFHFQLELDDTSAAEPDIQPVLERAELLRHAGPEGPEPHKTPNPQPPD
jgi:hypothetical protein